MIFFMIYVQPTEVIMDQSGLSSSVFKNCQPNSQALHFKIEQCLSRKVLFQFFSNTGRKFDFYVFWRFVYRENFEQEKTFPDKNSIKLFLLLYSLMNKRRFSYDLELRKKFVPTLIKKQKFRFIITPSEV